MIIELYDSKKNYSFNVIKSERIANDYQRLSLTIFIPKAIPVAQKELNKLKLELYSNPFKYIFNGSLTMPEGKKLLLDDGTVLSKEELKPDERREREKIKSTNNPIELDRAIKYPTLFWQ